ncbi:23972_t:CDS:2 [Cetraspora pellucida]|uniref:23972_t:CDS:1 n=1 Tax=Cetraspora pellucida TaxID=1433469 RepID=A0A9N8Z624_9GLOM|nr:23972_t:CDS:2 [Cetraspora pellucida]
METICESFINPIIQSFSKDHPREGYNNNNFSIMAISLMELQMEDLRSSCIQEQLKDKGFSDRAAELYIASYDPKASRTVSAYHLYSQKMQFNTIMSYRSVISEIHVHVDGKSIGLHPIIIKVMKGLFNLNPPKQNSAEVVDVLLTIDYIQSLGSNTEMPILNLTQKTALLLALTSGSCPSDLH